MERSSNAGGQSVKRLEEVLRLIGEAIEVVRVCKCESAANLLEMAELELRMKIHDISEAELSAFCHELENRVHTRNRGHVIELRPKFEKMVRRKST
jgi:hypothetical protein